jgi:ketosteroid isomerase-like protein
MEQLDSTEQEILHLESQIFAAVKNQDTTALSLILTDDFVYRSPGSREVGKDEFLNIINSFPVKILSLWGEELKVNVYGDTAVLTGLQLSKTQSRPDQEEISAVMFTDVFLKRGDRWLLALAHATDLPEVPGQYLPKKSR